MGSTIYHMAMVACGSSFGAMLGYPSVWDVAAGMAILKCVGGAIFDGNHERLSLESLMRRDKFHGPMFACTESRFKAKTFEAEWVG
jgi:fructose-1,6-bisphosphatase/inositol monophosphatase family enzyme